MVADPDEMVPYQDRGYFNTSVAYFSPNATINPQMWNWNSIFLRYCDGQSFAGARTDAVVPTQPRSKALHFRGSMIQDAMIAKLLSDHDLAGATDLVVGGASAGGMCDVDVETVQSPPPPLIGWRYV